MLLFYYYLRYQYVKRVQFNMLQNEEIEKRIKNIFLPDWSIIQRRKTQRRIQKSF